MCDFNGHLNHLEVPENLMHAETPSDTLSGVSGSRFHVYMLMFFMCLQLPPSRQGLLLYPLIAVTCLQRWGSVAAGHASARTRLSRLQRD